MVLNQPLPTLLGKCIGRVGNRGLGEGVVFGKSKTFLIFSFSFVFHHFVLLISVNVNMIIVLL